MRSIIKSIYIIGVTIVLFSCSNSYENNEKISPAEVNISSVSPELKEEERKWRDIVKENPQDYIANYDMGVFYYNLAIKQLKQTDSAKYQKIVDDPHLYEKPLEALYYNLSFDDVEGETYALFNLAAKYFEKAYTIDSSSIVLMEGLKGCYFTTGHAEKVEDLNTLINDQLTKYSNKEVKSHKFGLPEESKQVDLKLDTLEKKMLEKQFEDNPNDWNTNYNLAKFYYNNAVERLKSLDVPDNHEVTLESFNQNSYTYKEMSHSLQDFQIEFIGLMHRALPYFKKAYALDSSSIKVLHGLSGCYFAFNDIEKWKYFEEKKQKQTKKNQGA